MSSQPDQMQAVANKATGQIDVLLNGVRVAEITLDHAVDFTVSLMQARSNAWAAKNIPTKKEKARA